MKDAENSGLDYVRIIRSRVLKKQLVEIDGCRLFLTGAEEFRNAREVVLSVEDLLAVTGTDDSVEVDKHLDELWASFMSENGPAQGLLYAQLNLPKYVGKFEKLTIPEKRSLLLGLIRIANAGSNVVDLSFIGGSKNSGRIKPARSKLLGDPNVDFYIIDQSVTGMFERKTRVGL